MKLSALKQALLARLKMSLLKLARLKLTPLKLSRLKLSPPALLKRSLMKLSLLTRPKQRLLRQSGSGVASPTRTLSLLKQARLK